MLNFEPQSMMAWVTVEVNQSLVEDICTLLCGLIAKAKKGSRVKVIRFLQRGSN